MNEKKKCQKLKAEFGFEQPTILIGIVLDNSDGFITFKTAKKTYKISQAKILSIEETEEDFVENA